VLLWAAESVPDVLLIEDWVILHVLHHCILLFLLQEMLTQCLQHQLITFKRW